MIKHLLTYIIILTVHCISNECTVQLTLTVENTDNIQSVRDTNILENKEIPVNREIEY